jgi:hypothetical protein
LYAAVEGGTTVASRDRRATLEVGEPDVGFQAGFGFYLGVVVTGVVAVAGLLAGTSTATLLGVLPSTVTAVAVVGHLFARRARGLPERIGRSRARRLACYVPAAAFAAVLVGARFLPVDATGRFVVLTLVATALAGVSGFGLERMSRNRYVDAITPDEPVARWTWHRTEGWAGEPVTTVILTFVIVGGVVSVWHGNWYLGPLWILYGVVMLLSRRYDWYEENDRWNPPEIRAHGAGLVVDRPFRKTLVPWAAIDDIRLTEDELVVERRRFGLDVGWFDVRCDRSAIDDPESVREALERARRRAGRRDSRAVETAD